MWMLRHRFTWSLVVMYLVTFQVLEPDSKTDTTLLLNVRNLRLFENELFLQIGGNIPKAALAILTLQSTSVSLLACLQISHTKYVNWFSSSTWCPFRTIALVRRCLVVDELTILIYNNNIILAQTPEIEIDVTLGKESNWVKPSLGERRLVCISLSYCRFYCMVLRPGRWQLQMSKH